MADPSIPTKIVSAAAVPGTSGENTVGNTPKAVTGIADNFQTFLTLLTTQLKHQNPLDPLNTNQFTQQLVQFAGVEQQLKSNEQLASLVKLQTAAESTQALNFVGAIAVVDGATVKLKSGSAVWAINVTKPSSVDVSIRNSAGQTVFSGNYAFNAGQHHSFSWDGKGADGTRWPDGNYTISATAKDTSGQATAASTEIQGVVDSVDPSQTPPQLSIGGQTFTMDKVKRIVRAKG